MLQKIRERTYLIRGSPNTLLYEYYDKVFVIDPGSELERGKTITNEVAQNFNDKKIEVLLTHSHSDHVAALATFSKDVVPYISEQEISSLIDIKTRKALTYSSSTPSSILYRFVDYAPENFRSFKLGSKIEEIETIDLRGHSLGHAGFLTSDGVLYTGDSFFGDKLISAVGVPYYLNYEDAVSSLNKLKEIIRKDFVIVMAHGPVMKYKEALSVLDMNIKLMEEIKEKVLSFSGLTAEEITYKLLKEAGVGITESSLVLSGVTIRSILGYLAREGFLQTKVSEKGIVWAKKSR
ncbi:MAG: MBL fold metallo-hydrolase [Thermoproteota archaeon]|jgi:glyoxylase-like metal-dependent hydrolase (beta-lactamase superfamily II)